MTMLEVAYQLRDDVNYMVGSESFIRTHKTKDGGLYLNWLVDKIYQPMVDNPDITPSQLCIKSVEEFVTDRAYILPPAIIKPGSVDCISAIDVNKTADVAVKVDELAKGLLSRPVLYRFFLSRVFFRTQSFSGGYDFFGLPSYPYLDLYDFAQNVKRYIPNQEIKNLADDVMSSIESAVFAERHGNSRLRFDHVDAHGLSIYLPYRKRTYNALYEDLDLAIDTSWDEFIKNVWLSRSSS